MRSKSLQQLLWLASCIILTSVDLYYASRLMRYIVGDPTRMFRPVYSSPYTLFFRRFTSSKNDAWVTVFEKMNRTLDTFWIVFKHCEITFWKKKLASIILSFLHFFKKMQNLHFTSKVHLFFFRKYYTLLPIAGNAHERCVGVSNSHLEPNTVFWLSLNPIEVKDKAV